MHPPPVGVGGGVVLVGGVEVLVRVLVGLCCAVGAAGAAGTCTEGEVVGKKEKEEGEATEGVGSVGGELEDWEEESLRADMEEE